MRTERQIESNAMMHLMTLPNGKKADAKALGIQDALTWSEEAEKIHEDYAAANGDRTKQKSAMLDIIDCVASYPWVKHDDALIEDIKKTASSEQIVNAFYLLRDINDPFVVAAKREERSQKEELEGVKDLMAMLPDDQKRKLLDAGLEKLQTP